MGMPRATTHWTADLVRVLPDDGNRYEVVDGELFVTPAPRLMHQAAVLALVKIVDRYVADRGLGRTLFAPADIEFSPGRLVQPDVFVAPRVDGRLPRNWDEIRELLLAVEVLSPSSSRADRQAKRIIYQQQRVPEYWVVDVDARVVERWRLDDDRAKTLADVLIWQPAVSQPPLTIDLTRYFAEVWRD